MKIMNTASIVESDAFKEFCTQVMEAESAYDTCTKTDKEGETGFVDERTGSSDDHTTSQS